MWQVRVVSSVRIPSALACSGWAPPRRHHEQSLQATPLELLPDTCTRRKSGMCQNEERQQSACESCLDLSSEERSMTLHFSLVHLSLCAVLSLRDL